MRNLSAALIARVAIASPSDVGNERKVVDQTIHSWNQRASEREGIAYLSYMWERDVAARSGRGGGQDVIDRKIIHNAHVVIGVFGVRLGSAASGSVSGTVHEIEEGIEAGLPVHVLFSKKAIPRNVDRTELRRLEEYQEKISGTALYREFSTPASLRAEVEKCLDEDAAELKILGPEVLALAADVIVSGKITRRDASSLSLRIQNMSNRVLDGIRLEGVRRSNGTSVRTPNTGRIFQLGQQDYFDTPISDRQSGPDIYRVQISWTGAGKMYSSELELHAEA